MTQTITGLFDHYDGRPARGAGSRGGRRRTSQHQRSSAMTRASMSATTASVTSPILPPKTLARERGLARPSAVSAVCSQGSASLRSQASVR